jgi:DNA-binding MarR family transcriptional regulator
MTRQELLQDLIEKMTKAIQNMHTGQSFPFGDFMLGKQQIMILFFVFENKGEASVKEIAKFLNVTSGAVTQFIDGLVEKKMVIREENPMDRRSINIKLTENTKLKFSDFKKMYIKVASLAFREFADEDLKQFIKLLEKIKKANS